MGMEKLISFFHLQWLNNWSESPVFCLTPHTSDALIRTLYAQILLLEELLNSGYEYVILHKLQSDPLEKRFSQYRQMSGGRFLVSLREVLNSEQILQCRSLLKENVIIWEDDVAPVVTHRGHQYSTYVRSILAIFDPPPLPSPVSNFLYGRT